MIKGTQEGSRFVVTIEPNKGRYRLWADHIEHVSTAPYICKQSNADYGVLLRFETECISIL